MRRLFLAVVLALLLALEYPLEGMLRASAPPRADAARIGVGRVLGSVLAGAFRPLLLNFLWIRAGSLYRQQRHDELHAHIRTMIALYPDNERAREFLGWMLAFNLKSEESDRELAWRWAREGLDILARTPGGRRQAAYWCLAQCGQNSLDFARPMRYAGDAWEGERWWRERIREWSAERLGRPLDRFETGLALLQGRSSTWDLAWRSALAERLIYDEWIRTGRAPDFERCVALMHAYRREVSDNPPYERAIASGIDLIESLQERRPRPVPVEPFPRAYRVAMAVLGIGVAQRDADLVRAAGLALQRLDRAMDPERELFAAEAELVRSAISRAGR